MKLSRNGLKQAFRRGGVAWPLGLVAMLLLSTLHLESAPQPTLSIIIDDMGYSQERGAQALALPGSITYAFLPHTPHTPELAERAHRLGREVMLHLPMEPREGNARDRGMLRLHMAESEFRRTLLTDIASVPYVAGVNNHMGSRLTRDEAAMGRLMDALSMFDLYFIDSRTTDFSVAEDKAGEIGIPSAARSVFLDHVASREFVRMQLEKLVGVARRHGTAIGIGHPREETMDVLAEELPRLQRQGVRIVPASKLTKIHREKSLWHAFLSLSRTAAKN